MHVALPSPTITTYNLCSLLFFFFSIISAEFLLIIRLLLAPPKKNYSLRLYHIFDTRVSHTSQKFVLRFFFLFFPFRLEKVRAKSLRSVAKIAGTVVCVGGAVCMALVKGPKLLNTQMLLRSKSLLYGFIGAENLQLGCLVLFLSCCCWSFWMIMQVQFLNYPIHHLKINIKYLKVQTIASRKKEITKIQNL